MGELAMQVHFDGSFAHDPRALETWRSVTGSLFYTAGRRLGQDCAEGSGRIASMDLAGVTLVDVVAPPGRSARDSRALQGDGVDALFVSVMASGRARLEARHAEVAQNAGDVVAWDAAQPHMWVHQEPTKSICVRLPRRLVKLAQPERLACRTLAAGSPMCTLASSIVAGVARLGATPRGAHALRLRSALVDALVGALMADEPASRAGQGLRDAKDYMLARLDDPSLAPMDVAAAACMSQRSLARHFAAEGTTLMQWLWQQRLERGRELLAHGEAATVAQAAAACGFTSFAHFSRAFRAAYGHAPSTLLTR